MEVKEKIRVKGITSYTTYETGELKECKVNEHNVVKFKNTELVPRYKEPDERKRDAKAMSFYRNGNLKSIALEEQTEITTPIGVFPAELVILYEDGEIDSLFPLNGQIGFGWSLEDEEKLLKEFIFDLSVGKFTAKIIGLRFYNSGRLKSMILWPREIIKLQTPIGARQARVGFRLYENGALESFEPAKPMIIKTGIGDIIVFDQNAVGMDADYNSVRFYPDGNLLKVSTNSDIVINNKRSGQRVIIYQQMRFAMTSDKMVKIPVKIIFKSDEVIIDNGVQKEAFSISESKFLFLHDGSYMEKKCSPGSDCSGCGGACV